MALQESATLGQKAHDARELAQRVYAEATNLGQTLFGPRPEAADAPKRATQSVDDDVDEVTVILRQAVSVLSSLNQNVAIGANRLSPIVYDESTMTGGMTGPMPTQKVGGSRW